MINVAILGYGTIGSGVARVLETNRDVIAERVGDAVCVKYILDLRDFPGDENEDKIIHDYNIIIEDPEIEVVVECMGGTGAAYAFVKEALLHGRSVATSNKELVASNGPELIAIAKDKNVNFQFEASVGGGIPIIRPLLTSLTGDVVEGISGILNGTTNYMLTQMETKGVSFEEALKDAQERGYAELHPEADVEGFDACRKIAILLSLTCGRQVRYEDIYTEGIRNITREDISYARKMHSRIKLLASGWREGDRFYAIVSPLMISQDHPLAGVNDVFNAICVRGNMVEDTMFYGKGAGSLPTASAVVGDVIDCIRRKGNHFDIIWEAEKQTIDSCLEFERRFFVRMSGDTDDALIREAFGEVTFIENEEIGDKAFITGVMKEKDYERAADQVGGVISRIRVDQDVYSW